MFVASIETRALIERFLIKEHNAESLCYIRMDVMKFGVKFMR